MLICNSYFKYASPTPHQKNIISYQDHFMWSAKYQNSKNISIDAHVFWIELNQWKNESKKNGIKNSKKSKLFRKKNKKT